VGITVPGQCHLPSVKAAIEAEARDAWRRDLLSQSSVEGERELSDPYSSSEAQ
jgi:hypothetical protein